MIPAIGKCKNIPGFDDILMEYSITLFSDPAIFKPNLTEQQQLNPDIK